MFSSMNRKRDRDASDDAAVSSHHDKKLRCSAGHEHGNTTSTAAAFHADGFAMNSLERISSGEDHSISSTRSEASSSDTDMDLDTSFDSRTAFSHSPEQSASTWVLKSAPIRNPRMVVDDKGIRIPTPIVNVAIRPQPMPVQVANFCATTARSHLGHAVERFPSPISEDEPHTPTTTAGSQFSLLTVTDVDMDVEPTDPPEPAEAVEPVTVRKQRQRSGAFTSPREPSKKFTMGYREDCERCRNRVPGHMNHFLGS